MANDLLEPSILPCSVSAAGGLSEAGEGEASEVMHSEGSLHFSMRFYAKSPPTLLKGVLNMICMHLHAFATAPIHNI